MLDFEKEKHINIVFIQTVNTLIVHVSNVMRCKINFDWMNWKFEEVKCTVHLLESVFSCAVSNDIFDKINWNEKYVLIVVFDEE